MKPESTSATAAHTLMGVDFDAILQQAKAEESLTVARADAPAAVQQALEIGFACLADLSRMADHAPHPSMQPTTAHALPTGRVAAVASFMRAFECVKAMKADA